jgi:putative transposase
MVHYRRLQVKGGIYFFTVALQDRKSTLLTQYIRVLQKSWKSVQVKRPFKTIAYVILPDHFHAVWQLPEDDNDFPTRLRLIKRQFTKNVVVMNSVFSKNKRNEYNIWQKRYWEHMIRDERDYENHINYIHYNPIKHKYVKRTRDWPYSSFMKFVNQGIYKLNWSDNIYKDYIDYDAE